MQNKRLIGGRPKKGEGKENKGTDRPTVGWTDGEKRECQKLKADEMMKDVPNKKKDSPRAINGDAMRWLYSHLH